MSDISLLLTTDHSHIPEPLSDGFTALNYGTINNVLHCTVQVSMQAFLLYCGTHLCFQRSVLISPTQV